MMNARNISTKDTIKGILNNNEIKIFDVSRVKLMIEEIAVINKTINEI